MAGQPSLVNTYFTHEYRSPPVPLVALIGCPQYHKAVSDFFLHALKPPLVSLCCNDPVEQFVPRAFSTSGSDNLVNKSNLSKSSQGILKSDWLTKHRQRRPAAALVIITRQELEGDPSAWNRMLYTLKFIRDAATPRGAGMVVGVVQPPGAGSLPGDRLTSLCHHLCMDPRCVLPLPIEAPALPPADEGWRVERDAALRAAGTLASDQCAAYYARRTKHVSDKHAERRAAAPDGKCTAEVNARAAIKLAVYAEFRQDWRAAVQDYQAAYSHVKAVITRCPPASPPPTPLHPSASTPQLATHPLASPNTSPLQPHTSPPARTDSRAAHPVHAHHASWSNSLPGVALDPALPPHTPTGPTQPPISLQTFMQAARVAELLQLKLIILLAYRERLEEAVAQANTHIQFFMHPPVSLPPAAAAAHAGYIIRQLQVTAEVLSTKLEGSVLAVAAKECSRSTLLASAAQVSVQRRRQTDQLAASRAAAGSSAPSLDSSLIKKGPCVGTVAVKTDTATRELSESEFLLWLESEELRSASTPGGGATPAASSGGAPGGVSVGQQTGLTGTTPSVVDIINTALMGLRDGHLERQRSWLCTLLAEEHQALGNLAAARKLLLQVAATYRRDGWDLLLAQVLLLLRELAQRLRLASEHITYSLELAVLLRTLPLAEQHTLAGFCTSRGLVLPTSDSLCTTCVGSLLAGVHDAARLPGIIKPSQQPAETTYSPVVTGGSTSSTSARGFTYIVEWLDLAAASAARRTGSASASGAAGKAGPDSRPHTVADLLTRHHQQDFGWARVLSMAVSFPGDQPPDAQHADLHVGLLNNLPDALTISGMDITFADELAEHWKVPAVQEAALQDLTPATHASSSSHSRSGTAAGLQDGLNPPTTNHNLETPSQQHDLAASSDSIIAASVKQLGDGLLPAATKQPLRRLDVELQPGRWTHFATRITPRGVGRLRVESVTVYIGPHASVTYHPSTFPASCPDHSLGSVVERHAGLDARAALPYQHMHHMGHMRGTSIHVHHVGELPQLEVVAQHNTKAYVGEPFFIAVRTRVSRALPSSVLQFSVLPLNPDFKLSNVAVTVDDRGSLEKYHGHDTAQLQLPSIPDNGQHVARLWVTARQPGKLSVGVTLQCPAAVTQVVQFEVEDPLDLQVFLTAEPGNHVLVPPSLAPGTEGSQALSVGQAALAHCTIRHTGSGQQRQHGQSEAAGQVGPPADLELLSAQVSENVGIGVSFLTRLTSQVVGLDGQPQISLSPGDMAVLITSLLPATLVPIPASLGQLHITWRRKRWQEQEDTAQVAGGGESAAELQVGQLEQQIPRPNDQVITTLDLPLVMVQEGLLAIQAIAPAQATAGIAFSYTLQAQSFLTTPQELSVALLDAPGFVLSGDRSQQVLLPPRQTGGTAAVTWPLVAHATGQLLLPSVKVAAPRHSATLTSQPAFVHVLPF